MNETYHRMQRATTGRNVLSVLGIVFLVCSAAFWGVLHYAIFVAPVGLAIPQIIVAIVMTAVYSLALPLLLSMLVPTTPAGQLLQKTQWRTLGFPVIVASAGFLAWHARNLMLLWFSAQPAIGDAGQETAYTLTALIAFVVVPALAWVQVTPERWLQEIQTAHMVRKLEIEQRGELAILKARITWAETRALHSFAKLLPAEQKEVQDTIRGLLMGVADSQRAIAQTMGIQAHVEREILGDKEIADSMDYVARQLERPAEMAERTISDLDNQDGDEDYSPVPVPGRRRASARIELSEPRHAPAASRSATQRYAAEYETAFAALGRLFTVRELMKALANCPERTARDVLDAWREQGWVEKGSVNGQWRFAEMT